MTTMDIKAASKPDLLRAFFDALPHPGERTVEHKRMETAFAVINEMRRRAIDKLDLAQIRETHVMRHELLLTVQMVQAQNQSSQILVPQGAR